MKMMNKAFKILTIVLFTFISMISCAQKKEDSSMNNAKPTKAIIGVIGAGNVGGTLGKKWANAGYKVLFSSRNPEELKDLITEIGHQSEAVSVEEAAKRADIVVLAVPFKAESGISAQIQPFVKGKILLDCDNAYPGRDGAIADEARKTGVGLYSFKNYFPETKFIRAFSSLPVANVGRATNENRIEIPYAVSDESIKNIAEDLIKAADGTPKFIGGLENSAQLDF